VRTPAEAYEALLALPCGARLGGVDAWLVGGAVRDRLLGRPVTDVDLAIEGDARAAAKALGKAARGPVFALSDAFGAWRVIAGDRSWQADLTPLRGGSVEADLALRDFTINAIAEPLEGMEVWLGPALGFDLRERRLRIYGDGEGRVPWISADDVAAAATSAVRSRPVGTFELGGPAAVSPNEIVSSLERERALSFAVERVPAAILQAQYEGSEEPRQQAFFALAMACARGVTIAPERGGLPAPTTTIADYLTRTLGR